MHKDSTRWIDVMERPDLSFADSFYGRPKRLVLEYKMIMPRKLARVPRINSDSKSFHLSTDGDDKLRLRVFEDFNITAATLQIDCHMKPSMGDGLTS